jgi:hypothetical protein
MHCNPKECISKEICKERMRFGKINENSETQKEL